jgi:crossover junction endodeoxyribonuclease RuvC
MRAPPEENPPGVTGGPGILFHDRNDLPNKATIASAQAIVLGFDIGTGGAGALVTPAGELVETFDMPVLNDGPRGRRSVNAALLAEIVFKSHASKAFVEYVGARPGEGAVGAFGFGRSRGIVEGVLAAAGVPVTFLTPPTWKRLVGIPPGKAGAKDAARSEAIRRWPSHAAMITRVKDDGRAEAALIGVAGLIPEGRHG